MYAHKRHRGGSIALWTHACSGKERGREREREGVEISGNETGADRKKTSEHGGFWVCIGLLILEVNAKK